MSICTLSQGTLISYGSRAFVSKIYEDIFLVESLTGIVFFCLYHSCNVRIRSMNNRQRTIQTALGSQAADERVMGV